MTEEPSKLPRLTLARQIRDSLVSRIVSGQFRPGERLVETRLAATYGTSQAPVREALRELEVMRLVETQPRRGTFVRPFVQETLRESYVVRAALEETATRLALLAGTVPVEALRADVAAMRAAAESGDGEASARASVSFHRRIVEAAHNELLKLSWEGLQIEARTSVTMVATEVDLHDIVRDHAELLAAMEDGDLETACRQARDHQWHYADLPHDAHGRTRDSAAG
ncbi:MULTISPECIES: GntR family transcriptional regulator [unclassified Nonomuraea]|uniref:GntR family transcriptional regulator n=1 Tax=unclassified Nonomuraea TaxID=2593643 RepID=UPI001BE4C78E|nr:GntR family transcriptional regulator [Nonomuraea sp. NEAU-A123]MBT2227831.1 GntR family transcriptional regulator [Nonomuraea sp. NEAU-A123]